VSDALRSLLRAHSLGRTLTGLLSATALADLRHELAVLFGPPRLLLAMLVDEREEVRATAARWLRQEPVFVAIDATAAATRLHETFARLLEAAGAGDAAVAAPVTRETWKEAREHLEQQLRDTRAEARRLKGVDDRLARNRDQLAARERELAELQARLAGAETQARTAARERDEAVTELARELRHRDARLQAAVESRLATEAAAWLAPARAVAAEAATPATAGDALLSRASDALSRQAAADRHSGNRRTVATRQELLARRLAEVRDALANAMQPLPELAVLEGELSAEIERLDRLLNRRTSRTPLEELLAARAARATFEELQNLRGVVEQLTALGACSAEAAARLMETMEHRRRVAGAAALSPADADEADDTPAGVLRCALRGRCAAILLVDGHNVLFGLQGRYLPPQGAAVPTGAARARLIDDIVRLTADRTTCRAWIVFDGPTRSESTPSGNVRVTYSGGEGEHRADAALLDNIRFFRAGGEIPILLVTNDNALSGEARRLGARTLSALELGSFLAACRT
jgi:predicted RNA-binding protein with PIN domain